MVQEFVEKFMTVVKAKKSWMTQREQRKNQKNLIGKVRQALF